MTAIRHLMIVGGGTAGWLTAAYLARHLGGTDPADPAALRITVVESPEIGIIGVGEGSFPSLRGTLSALGIGEADFLREASATFKQGISFKDWAHAPGQASAAGGNAAYFHPFNTPSQRPGGPELLPQWLLGEAGPGRALAEACCLQHAVATAGHGPKRVSDADYLGPMNYAYHFDAAGLAQLLARRARALGVQHLQADVERVELAAPGQIAAVHTRQGERLSADFFVDCTGFRAELIGKALGEPLRSVADTLFVDRALALQLPYPDSNTPIACSTIASAQEAGWIWDIGLQARRGIGHVFSSRHCSDERAEQVLRAYAGPAADVLQPRLLKMQLGWRERQWVGNCVAIGLSSGFLEPLEASGIGLVETGAYLLTHLFPADGVLAPVAAHYNAFMSQRYSAIVDFLKLHYAISQRRDTAFWCDNTDPASWPEGLKQRLARWDCRPPHRLDFATDIEMYPPCSWQYVLYGLNHPTRLPPSPALNAQRSEARREFATLREVAAMALRDLPPHRALIEGLLRRATPV